MSVLRRNGGMSQIQYKKQTFTVFHCHFQFFITGNFVKLF